VGRRGIAAAGSSHLLAERFARGEIDESEYLARLAVLRRGRTG
jgi:putative membrane protein